MKRIVQIIALCFILSLTWSLGFSQKCKFDFDKKDPITGESEKQISFNPSGSMSIHIRKTGAIYHLNISIIFDGVKDEYLNKGDSITFKLESGKLINVYAMDKYPPTSDVSVDQIYTYYRPVYTITEEQLKQISDSPVVFLRIVVGSVKKDFEINDKDRLKFQSIVKCILQ